MAASVCKCVIFCSVTPSSPLAAVSCRRTCKNCSEETLCSGESLISEDPRLGGRVVLVNGVEEAVSSVISSRQEKRALIFDRRHETNWFWKRRSLPPLTCGSVVDLSVSQVLPTVVSSSHNDVKSVGGENKISLSCNLDADFFIPCMGLMVLNILGFL